MQQIDTRGRLCPEPLILTKRGIDSLPPRSEVEVITDNQTAKENLSEYLEQMNIPFDWRTEERGFVLSFITPERGETLEAEAFCRPIGGHFAIVLKGETMGEGDKELGAILMRGFINSLNETERKPSHIILYNSGVRLAQADRDTCASLLALERSGVTVLLCGTCVDFFEMKASVGVGVIGNMLKITRILTESSKVIYP